MKTKKIGSIILFIITMLIYIVIYYVNKQLFFHSLRYFGHIFLKLFYILLIVFFFIFITNLFLKPKTIIKYLGRGSGIRGWIISIVAGIISMGSIYLWYPILSDLREKGMSEGLIAVFLYNRAVKIPILPVMIYYFGWAFVTLLTFFMVLFSILLGIIMDRSSIF